VIRGPRQQKRGAALKGITTSSEREVPSEEETPELVIDE